MADTSCQPKPYRLVNVVPVPKAAKVKKEVIEEDDEDTVLCRLCGKSFSNEKALGNHARMEHMDAYDSGDPAVWTQELFAGKKARLAAEDQLVKQRTQQMLSVMEPTSLTSLASADVSYIIIKAEDDASPGATAVKRRKVERVKEKVVMLKKEKEAQPITGPFECLQPSSTIAGGTCHQIFFSCCEYSAHHRDEHTRRRKGVRCQVCEAPLTPQHQAPHVCQVCGQGFETIDELTDHTNSAHVKLKPYECSVCHKRFTHQGGVQQHMRMHTGDRPFPCTFCPKAFTQKSGLDQHLRIHTKVKPYRCVICDKKFCQSVHLKQHMRTHTHVAPFQCAICQKRFKQSSHLNYHLKAHNANSDIAKEYYVGDKQVVEVEIAEDVAYIAQGQAEGEYIVGDPWGQEGQEEVQEEIEVPVVVKVAQ